LFVLAGASTARSNENVIGSGTDISEVLSASAIEVGTVTVVRLTLEAVSVTTDR
jgi:hypothetical protein